MIESDIRRPARNNREFRDGWLADLADMGSTGDVYAERQDPSTLSITGALRSREANMADRYGRDGRGSHDGYRAASSDSAQHPADEIQYDDEGSLTQDEYDRQYGAAEGTDDPQWTYDEKLGVWVDRHGQPYVEAYAPGEEDRYAPSADDEYLAPQADARRSTQKSRGGMGGLAAVLLVAAMAGGGAYAWHKGAFIGSDLPGLGGPPPVIKASTDPVKIKPAETTAAVDQPVQEIFNRNGAANVPQNERLVPHEEQPMAEVPVRSDAGTAASANGGPSTRSVTTSNITLPATAPDATEVPAGDTPQEARRVKTIKVLPDNSVVTGDAPISGTDQAPQPASPSPVDIAPTAPQAPTEPTPPVASQPAPETTAAAPAQTAQVASVPVASVPATSVPVTSVPVTSVPVTSAPVTPAPATGNSNGDTGNADAIDNATTVVTPTPPANSASAPVHTAIPPVRPRNIPAETPAKPTQTAAAESVPVASPIPSAVGYVVQVSSQRTPADAQAAFQSLQRKYASVIGNMKPSIKKAELGDRGTYYRVRVGLWSSSTEASTFCAKLKAAGGDCVIARN